jgi:hypothetical protein
MTSHAGGDSRGDGSGPRRAPGEGLTVLKYTSMLLGLLLVVKAYGVAHFSLTVTGSLISTKPVDALLGTIASYEYLALPLLAISVGWWSSQSRHDLPAPIRGAAAAVVLITTLLSPVTYLWILVSLAMPLLVVADLFHRTSNSTHNPSAWMSIPLVTSFALLALAIRHLDNLVHPSHYQSRWSYAWFLVGAALLSTAVFDGFRRLAPKIRPLNISKGNPLPYFCALTAALFLLATIDKPWTPAEVVVTKRPVLTSPKDNRRESLPTLYVLSSAGGDLVALTADTRFIVRVPSSNVVARVICHQTGQLPGQRPLLFVLERKDYTSPNLACWRLKRNLMRRSLKL